MRSRPPLRPLSCTVRVGPARRSFAEYIHTLSQRSGGFHAFSVGTVAPQLALDELFGHVPGAYTDARKMRTGRIAAAGVGTLLLDDMQTVDLGVQKQLLPVLDRGTFSPVGSDRLLTVACRIILAMTEEPGELMKKGLLLKDLRFRFGLGAIRMAPLRERRAEIPLLAQRALERCPEETEVEGPTRFSDGAVALLREGEWEGNVRELEAAVEYGYLMARAAGAMQIGIEHIPAAVHPVLQYRRHGDPEVNRIAVERALEITVAR